MPSASSRKQPRMSGAERREQLLDVTREIVGELGFHAVSIEAVARRAGITRPVVYGHFADLPTLLEAMVERESAKALGQLDEILPSPGSGLQPARRPARRDARLPRGGEHRSGDLATGADAARGRPARAARARSPRAATRSSRRSPMSVGPGLGSDGESPDPQLTARTLSAIADEAARLLLTDPAEYPIERLIAHADWLLARLEP